MTLPNFLILGTQKAGTRWMVGMLAQHPDVFMPPYEVHYFDRADNFARGPGWYESHFADARAQAAIGEKTPNYLLTEPHDPLERPRRIHELLPGARLVAILRNPVERAISGINHHLRVGYLPADVDLDDAIHRFVAEDRDYIRYGYYQRHLEAYRRFFDPAQMLTLIYEDDVVARPLPTLRRVCEFLGVEPSFGFTDLDKRVNESRMSEFSTRWARRLPINTHLAVRILSGVERVLCIRGEKRRPSDRSLDLLYDHYAADNARLFQLLGREVTSWARSGAHITR